MKISSRLFFVAALVLVQVLLSCSEDPTRVGRPPVVEGFHPSDQILKTFVGDTLLFSIRAIDPDHAALQHRFIMGDSVVSHSSHWAYVVADTGAAVVRCVVSNAQYESRINWQLQRHMPVRYPPVVTDFSPKELNPTMIINRSLTFALQATDPDSDSLLYYFELDDSLVARSSHYTFTPDRVGKRHVLGVVTDGEHFATKAWNLTVTGIPDTIPPATVVITSLVTGTEPGEVDVDWTAVGKDSMVGTASEYFVRTSALPFLTEDDWDRGSVRPGVPDPLPAGETMHMTISGMIPARYTYVAVRAVDDFGNLSPLGHSPGAYTRGMRISGVVRDAVSGDSLSDVTVTLAHYTTTTNADGTFEFIELPPMEDRIGAADDPVDGQVGQYFDFSMPYTVHHLDHVELFLMADVPLVTTEYDDFLQFFRVMTIEDISAGKFYQRRWNLPIDLYVPPFQKGGLDYQQTIQDVAGEFDAILGQPVFHLVDAKPATGVFVTISADTTLHGFYGVQEYDSQYYPVQGEVTISRAFDAAHVQSLQVIARHELGHALGLNHSTDLIHIMKGGTFPVVTHFSDDEKTVLRTFYRLPRGLDVTGYIRE